MELTGKVIIFKDEEEANLWYKAITETKQKQKVKSTQYEIESLKNIHRKNRYLRKIERVFK